MKFIFSGMQRSGTKSFGDFFRKNGFRVCSWPEIKNLKLGDLWFNGLWIDILNSGIFKEYDAFEDGPFQDPSFVKFLSQYVESSKVVYFGRPPEDWYKSMTTHSNGLTTGNIERHCYRYDRLDELNFLRRNIQTSVQKLPLIGMKSHYINIYKRHADQIFEKFSNVATENFFSANLYDKQKFENMCKAFDLNFRDTQEQHSHKTKVSFESVVTSHNNLF